MEKVEFGKTGLEITTIGFGSWATGGSGWRAAWGSQDDEAVGAIRRAVELGWTPPPSTDSATPRSS